MIPFQKPFEVTTKAAPRLRQKMLGPVAGKFNA
jgi:hypothetical protein